MEQGMLILLMYIKTLKYRGWIELSLESQETSSDISWKQISRDILINRSYLIMLLILIRIT